ncbi:MAG TPA: DNA primase DnaG [Candidatus Lokiarchaeia archaeon]|nr:DNA primase DnaG [Candidatus Lokiarchaeia archaeon]
MANKDFQEFSTVKYEIAASFEIQGVVEKSDVVGAIFGQTEGLLGEELDIRELQKSGRIGRINVDMESKEGVTSGKITIPSSLDRVETAILAATIETVDRVGPCMAAFKLESLEDVRKAKRDKIIDRATQLLQKWDLDVSPETQEITDKVSLARLTEDIVEYGDDKLPAGPEIDTSDTVIITEGRADILNLLSIGVKNAIATNGTSVPKTIAELSKKKTTIALLDGDRGGDMILNELLQVGKIDFVARAPEGKEVEELTKKDLLKALQGKVPYINNKPATAASLNNFGNKKQQPERGERPERPERPQAQKEQRGPKGKGPKPKGKPGPKPKGKFDRSKRPERSGGDRDQRPPRYQRRPQASPTPVVLDSPEEVPDVIRETGKSVLGTTKAIFYDESLNSVKEVPTSLIVDELQKEGGSVRHILFDGIVSQRLLDISAQEGVQTITGTRVGNVNKPGSVKVFSIDQL